jgi:multiple antibiotic resistance protein
MSSIVNSFLLVYAGLFPIVDPVGAAPIFLSMTRRLSSAQRKRLATRVAINCFLLLLGSLVIGSYVLEFFGITLPVVRVAGGLVVASIGWKLLHQSDDVQDHGDASDAANEKRGVDPFYPLAMPLTVGPGSISVAITLGSQRPHEAARLADLAQVGAGALAGILAIAVTILLCYRYAERVIARLGESGTNVVVRLSAFILLCIGIQILWNGIQPLLHP